MGLFVPSLFIGALYGRLIGKVLSPIIPIDVGTYSLIGAASTNAGISRMTISLTVMLVEATGNLYYSLPIMLVIMCAKWVGDWFNKGIYDMAIEAKHIPFLEDKPPKQMEHLQIHTIMSKSLYTLNPVETLGRIWAVLKESAHSGYPVAVLADPNYYSSEKRCVGLMLRNQLLCLLVRRNSSESEMNNWLHYYPRFLNLKDIPALSAAEEEKVIDLRPFMHLSFYAVQQAYSISRAYRLFRTMGLRHLIIVDEENLLRGMVTRMDMFATLHAPHEKKSFFPERKGSLEAVNMEQVHAKMSIDN